jgi:hypothetical protein
VTAAILAVVIAIASWPPALVLWGLTRAARACRAVARRMED